MDHKIKKNILSEEAKIIYLYRYLSWAFTSFVYLTGRPYSIIFFKLGVIVSLFISSKITTDLYIKFSGNKKIIRTLVLVETLGITILLLPTGGIKSSFIWYALNPTLVAACYLPAYFCWLNLVFYMFAGSYMSYAFFNPSNFTMIGVFSNNSNLVLEFILITLAVQLLAGLAKKSNILNTVLMMTNSKKEESLDHIMSLYQIIEALNNHSTKESLLETLAIYTAKLTKSDLSFLYLSGYNGDEDFIRTNRNLEDNGEQIILLQLQELELYGNDEDSVRELKLNDENFLVSSIMSTTNYFGLIGIQKSEDITIDEIKQNIKLLKFLSELSSITLERFNLEDIEDHLLVMKEQNRIADEIHDSVSQRLFSISYAIHGVLGKWSAIPKEEIKEYLIEMRESSNEAMKELRNSIYELSSKKKGERSLQIAIKSFLNNMAKLNHIIIDFDVVGDEDLLTLPLKKGITRIIREACSNAIRHGRCKQIHIDLVIHREVIKLTIADNGNGFILNRGDLENKRGLGISNMKSLVNSFNGEIKITSELGNGTEIHIIICGEGFNAKEQGGVLYEDIINR